jgi:hypothetical protein
MSLQNEKKTLKLHLVHNSTDGTGTLAVIGFLFEVF